jgi:hypothetical protein
MFSENLKYALKVLGPIISYAMLMGFVLYGFTQRDTARRSVVGLLLTVLGSVAMRAAGGGWLEAQFGFPGTFWVACVGVLLCFVGGLVSLSAMRMWAGSRGPRHGRTRARVAYVVCVLELLGFAVAVFTASGEAIPQLASAPFPFPTLLPYLEYPGIRIVLLGTCLTLLIGIVVNVVSMQRHGANRLGAIAAISLLSGYLGLFALVGISTTGRTNTKALAAIFALSALAIVASACMALVTMRQFKARPGGWTSGRQRSRAAYILGIGTLLALFVVCFQASRVQIPPAPVRFVDTILADGKADMRKNESR